MSLGSVIRSARESARLSIDDLASLTAIRPGLLMQMEADDFSGCGGDTYARGHLRAIATKLKMDPQELLDMYALEHTTQVRSMEDLLVESNVTTPKSEKRQISFKTLSLVSLGIIAVAAIVQIVVSNSSSVAPKAKSTVSASPTPSAPVKPTPSASTSAALSPTTNTLKITAARGNASIDIVTKDGHLYKGWLLQGQSKEFTSDARISIYVSNAGDIDLVVNGEAIPSLGAHGQEVRRTFP